MLSENDRETGCRLFDAIYPSRSRRIVLSTTVGQIRDRDRIALIEGMTWLVPVIPNPRLVSRSSLVKQEKRERTIRGRQADQRPRLFAVKDAG